MSNGTFDLGGLSDLSAASEYKTSRIRIRVLMNIVADMETTSNCLPKLARRKSTGYFVQEEEEYFSLKISHLPELRVREQFSCKLSFPLASQCLVANP
ncbi:hypothetical protein EVAR_70008_1 [Eumeta japonica]|uniref:Uncharacterized protein n=1 Tax=Eumeta variegata TaxID=151549 RepID=A0A4C1SV91_EUMVA|nr:hypothetical protein EVAR_70008_1 [Eumeta japonica]